MKIAKALLVVLMLSGFLSTQNLVSTITVDTKKATAAAGLLALGVGGFKHNTFPWDIKYTDKHDSVYTTNGNFGMLLSSGVATALSTLLVDRKAWYCYLIAALELGLAKHYYDHSLKNGEKGVSDHYQKSGRINGAIIGAGFGMLTPSLISLLNSNIKFK